MQEEVPPIKILRQLHNHLLLIHLEDRRNFLHPKIIRECMLLDLLLQEEVPPCNCRICWLQRSGRTPKLDKSHMLSRMFSQLRVGGSSSNLERQQNNEQLMICWTHRALGGTSSSLKLNMHTSMFLMIQSLYCRRKFLKSKIKTIILQILIFWLGGTSSNQVTAQVSSHK